MGERQLKAAATCSLPRRNLAYLLSSLGLLSLNQPSAARAELPHVMRRGGHALQRLAQHAAHGAQHDAAVALVPPLPIDLNELVCWPLSIGEVTLLPQIANAFFAAQHEGETKVIPSPS